MNILYINHYAGSKSYGMEYRPYFLCREWVKDGNIVNIISASFAHTRTIQPTVKRDFTKEIIEGINYFWLKTPKYSGNGVKRFINILTFVSKLFKYQNTLVNEFKPDIVIASSTYPLDILGAYKIAKKAKAKLVYEVPDLWPLTLIEVGGFSKFHPFVMLLQYAENFAYRKCSKVVCVLPKAFEYMEKHGLSKEKFVYIPNGIASSDWENSDVIENDLANIISGLKKNKFVIGYSGYHGLANSLTTLINAAEMLKDKDIVFFLIGDGPEKINLQKQVKELKLKNVVFHSSIAKSSIPDFLSRMDALFLAFNPLPIYRFGVSTNKLFDYMMSAKPVIQVQNAGNDYVVESGCGISVPTGNDENVAKAIINISLLTQKERDRMGKQGKEYVLKNNNYKFLSNKYLTEILQP